MVKIVVFDLDGTLYDSHKHIDKDTVHKIIELEQKGIVVGIVTGRFYEELDEVIEKLKLREYNGFVASSNGLEIHDFLDGEIKRFTRLSKDEVKELIEEATIRKIEIVQQEGNRSVTRPVAVYNLDAVIAVGYRVNSYEATQFRMWCASVLKEFLLKGFVLDDERLKNTNVFGKDYFDELLIRIREIRTSERRYYQKITDIYAECSADYDPKSTDTKNFYRIVQNTMHWAITHKTAAEIIYERADAEKPNMGLMTWKHAPHGRILANQ